MPGASVAIVGVPFTEPAAAAAGNTEIRFEPGTRVVVDEALPAAAEDFGGLTGMDARWYRTVTSRSSAAGVTTEIAELKCYTDFFSPFIFRMSGVKDDVIADADELGALGQITEANFGTILAGTMLCLETPTANRREINLATSTSGGVTEDSALPGFDNVVAPGVDWAAGDSLPMDLTALGVGRYLYYTVGAAQTAGDYDAGKFLLTFICRYDVPS